MIKYVNRRDSNALKFSGVKTRFNTTRDDIVPMWLADMEFAPPQCAVNAVQQFASLHTGYQSQHYHSLVVAWYKKMGMVVQRNAVVPFAGLILAYNTVLAHLVNSSPRIVCLCPDYGPLQNIARQHSANVCGLPVMCSGAGWHFDVNAIHPNTDAVVFSHPHNPTGELWHTDLLSHLAEHCARHNILIICDEAHAGLTAQLHYNSMYTHSVQAGARAVVLGSINKAFNLAAINAGSFAVTTLAEDANRLNDVANALHLSPSALSEYVFNAVVNSEQSFAWLESVNARIASNKAMVSHALAGFLYYVQILPTGATYFLWLNFTGLPYRGRSLQHELCDVAGIAMNCGEEFGAPGFARMNVAMHPDTIDVACTRLRQWLSEYSVI